MVQKYKEKLKETMFLRKSMSNKRKLFTILFLATSSGMSNSVHAQNDFEDAYNSFKRQAETDYEDFRKKTLNDSCLVLLPREAARAVSGVCTCCLGRLQV